MVDVNMNRVHLIGSGYAEMPQNGKRYRFLVNRYRHDDGSEWGQIVSMEEVPDVGPYFWVPSWGAENADEADYLREEFQYDQQQDQEQWDAHRAKQAQKRKLYDELRDKRAELIKRSPRTLGGDHA